MSGKAPVLTVVSLEDTVSGKPPVSPVKRLYQCTQYSTVVSLEDTVSGKAPVSPVKWLCIGLSVHTVVQ